MGNRTDLIIQHFGYLITDYGFYVEQKEFDSLSMGNAFVIFKSSKIGIEIVIDRNQVMITIGDQLDANQDWFEFSNVLRYFAPNLKDAYIFLEKTEEITWDEVIVAQLNRLAKILRQYCEPILQGNLSMKREINLIQERRKVELLEQFNLQSKSLKKGNTPPSQ